MARHVHSVKLGAGFPLPHLSLIKILPACWVSPGSDMKLYLVSSRSLGRYSSLEFRVPGKYSFILLHQNGYKSGSSYGRLIFCTT